MNADDSIKKAVKSEKKRLKEQAELKKERKKLLFEVSLNDTPSRVKVDAGKELIIEPRPLLNNTFRYVFSYTCLSALSSFFGWMIVYVMVIVFLVSYLVSQLQIPISKELITIGSFVIAGIYVGKDYVVGAVKTISALNEPFHLKVSGKNFMVHTGNPEEYIAASTKVDSDGNWNIMAEIDETSGSLKITWVYGSDINNSTTGGSEWTKHKNMLDYHEHLNLSDVELIRKFLNDNVIEIASDRRFNE